VAKYNSVVDDIAERHAAGQPVLVGTVSVEKSEYLSDQLRRRGVPHEVLNAKQHEREAAIVAQAGRKGAVTVATNMAGRGTDIMLGGNPEFMAVATLKQRGLDPEETPEDYEAAWDDALAKAEEAVQAEHDEVTELGGLYVLGTERHESRRIDNQLRGRSGRQGDPGESRFYLSLQDDLMRLFNAAMVDRFMTTAKMEDEVPIESKMVSRSIQSAQGQVEGRNFEIRKNVLKYDDVLNRQRTVIYQERRRVLEGEDLEEQVRLFINDVVNGYIEAETSEGFADDWDLDRLWTALKTLYPVSVTPDDIVEAVAGGDRGSLTADDLREQITSDAHHAYDAREAELGEEVMREVERRVVLSVLDRKWREHLYEMDYLQEGIGLRAMAQRDPLVEYQREGFQLFEAMNESIKEESVGYLFNVQVDVDQPAQAAPAVQAMSVTDMLAGSGLSGAESPVDADADAAGAGASLVEDRREDALAAPAARDDAALAAAETKTVTDQHPTFRAKGLEQPQRRQQLQYSAPGETGGTEHRSVGTVDDTLSPEQLKGASRNGPCPCGSGKKFKMCHGRSA
jgi:preprotein translocase subunit SecA